MASHRPLPESPFRRNALATLIRDLEAAMYAETTPTSPERAGRAEYIRGLRAAYSILGAEDEWSAQHHAGLALRNA